MNKINHYIFIFIFTFIPVLLQSQSIYRNSSIDWTPITIQGAGMKATRIFLVANSDCEMFNFTVNGTNNDGMKQFKDFTLDGNRNNNSLDNLQIVTHVEHNRIHNRFS